MIFSLFCKFNSKYWHTTITWYNNVLLMSQVLNAAVNWRPRVVGKEANEGMEESESVMQWRCQVRGPRVTGSFFGTPTTRLFSIKLLTAFLIASVFYIFFLGISVFHNMGRHIIIRTHGHTHNLLEFRGHQIRELLFLLLCARERLTSISLSPSMCWFD